MARRFGANPPESLTELRRDVERSILATFGILPSLVDPKASWDRIERSPTPISRNHSCCPWPRSSRAALSESLRRRRKAQHEKRQGDGLGNARSSNKQPDEFRYGPGRRDHLGRVMSTAGGYFSPVLLRLARPHGIGEAVAGILRVFPARASVWSMPPKVCDDSETTLLLSRVLAHRPAR